MDVLGSLLDYFRSLQDTQVLLFVDFGVIIIFGGTVEWMSLVLYEIILDHFRNARGTSKPSAASRKYRGGRL